jgi:hypothetical protein
VSHPLIELASGREVRQATGFRVAAAELDGPKLGAAYLVEKANAPRLHAEGRKYFVSRSGKPATERKRNKDEEHVGQALVRHCGERGAGLPLPDDDFSLLPLDYQVRVKTGPLDDPATKGIGRIDMLALTSDDRLAVVKLRVLEPSATRCGVGDTPLRALLEGLAYTAIVVLATPSYWRLCRKREAQKGAAWIKEMERLVGEVEAEVGPAVRYLGLELPGDPGWLYAEDGPVLESDPKLVLAWEPGAGRVRPKPRPRPRTAAPADVIVEADLSRPVRSYALTESYTAGDRIDHPKLGMGVVQGIAGPRKIRVRFEERESMLVHERGV